MTFIIPLTRRSHILPALILTGALLFASCKKDPESLLPDPGPNHGDIGKVSFLYRGQTVTYTSVRAKDGNIWTQQDLGASRVATTMKDTLAYGDFFQWGRWDDGHQVRHPVANTVSGGSIENNPSGVKNQNPAPFISGWWFGGNQNDLWSADSPSASTATNGCDPCRAMGSGWRLPTDAEWSNVAELEEIRNSETAYNSNLRIPTGGWRSTTNPSVITAVGADSWYWTSTASGTFGKGIWILPGGIRKSYSDNRSWGTSIRCMKSSE